MSNAKNGHEHVLSLSGLLITLGIIFGDIGTSPLYVMKAIVGDAIIDRQLILGAFSCIFWTLTFQTTLKYVVITLQADNNGEGGIFSLYALVRKRRSWLIVPAIIGGSTLLADGVITPSISISSAVEGLLVLNPSIPTVTIVIIILTILFFVQQFGTEKIGKAFGPVMLVWFSMLFILGFTSMLSYPEVLKAVNPYYAYELLVVRPEGFWILGAVFLCTTGAEALYSDLGHCGKSNIRVSWSFVKVALLMNYAGQCAWLLSLGGGKLEQNPFYAIMPAWFMIPGIIIATFATIIASQSLITGSFTLISEAIRLNFWPKAQIVYPSEIKGQLYIPSINFLLWIGCVFMMLYFKESERMESAYGLAITLTMLMTTILLYQYLRIKIKGKLFAVLSLVAFLVIELAFLLANSEKFVEGGWITLLISFGLIGIMLIWFNGTKIKDKYNDFVPLEEQIEVIKALSNDLTVPKYATHLIYLTSSNSPYLVDWKIIYSILRKQPKRADIYWFLHVTTLDDPYTMEYKVYHLAEDDLIWVEFRLGFRIQPRLNTFFRKVVEDLVKNHEVNITSRYESLSRFSVAGDFRFIVMERYLSYGIDFPAYRKIMLNLYFFLKKFSLSDAKAFGLDTSSVTTEMVPLAIPQAKPIKLKRIFDATPEG